VKLEIRFTRVTKLVIRRKEGYKSMKKFLITRWLGFTRSSSQYGMTNSNTEGRRSMAGVLSIEAAILAPIFIAFLFGLFEIGNWYNQGWRLVNVAQNLSTALQRSQSVSVHNMYRMTVASINIPEVNKSGGSVPNDCSPDVCEIPGLVWKVVASTTPTSQGMVEASSSSDWSNPWLKDGDPSNDRNPFFVGALVSHPAQTIFSRVFGKGPQLTRFSSGLVNPSVQPRITNEIVEFSFGAKFNRWDVPDVNPSWSSGVYHPFKRVGPGFRRVQLGSTTTITDIGTSLSDDEIIQKDTYAPSNTSQQSSGYGAEDLWGLRCRADQGWVAVGCNLLTGRGLANGTLKDLDHRLQSNGCYSDQEELVDEPELRIRCMRIIVD